MNKSEQKQKPESKPVRMFGLHRSKDGWRCVIAHVDFATRRVVEVEKTSDPDLKMCAVERFRLESAKEFMRE